MPLGFEIAGFHTGPYEADWILLKIVLYKSAASLPPPDVR
jgi:hypothetical protein